MRRSKEPTPPITLPGVTQSRLAVPGDGGFRQGVAYGDCWRACVATIFGFPAEAVPDFALFTWGNGAQELWARGMGKTVRTKAITSLHEVPDRLCMVVGQTERGTSHVVVYWDGRMIWDPHPSRAGLVEVRHAEWFEDWSHDDRTCWVCGAGASRQESSEG